MVRFVLIAAIAALGASCYSPDYGNGNVRCGGTAGECPSGLYCGTDGLCQRTPPEIGIGGEMTINGARWVQRASTTTPPSPRLFAALAYDPTRKRTVLFGGWDGVTGGVRFADTYEWDGIQWSGNLAPTTHPSGRYGAPMAYDGEKMVLFSGLQDGTTAADTWWLTGTTWSEPGVTGPPERQWWAAMAYDTVRQKVVYFGGRSGSAAALNDVWEWDRVTGSWSKRCQGSEPCATGPRPDPRYGHAMAYDSDRRVVVVFGGQPDENDARFGDTWEWNGDTWKQACSACGISARSRAGMAYDQARHLIVLFGGDQGGAETATWNGTQWTVMALAAPPPARERHGMVYDAERGMLVVFGGIGGGVMNDLWEFAEQ
jgi:hypothetical protein